MGGEGSGRYPRPPGKITVDAALSLDVRALQRTGLMQPGSWFVAPWVNARGLAQVTVEVADSAVRIIKATGAPIFSSSSSRCDCNTLTTPAPTVPNPNNPTRIGSMFTSAFPDYRLFRRQPE